MSLRQTIRETWDVAAMVVLIGLILGWALFIALVSPLMGQTEPRAIVTWDAVNDARLAGYKVKRGTSSGAYTQGVTVGNVNFWRDDSIEPTIKYYYAVVGFDALGQEGLLGEADTAFRFSDIQPASPANLTATRQVYQGRVTVTLSWSQVTKTRSLLLLPTDALITYRVFMSNTQGAGNVAGDVTSPSFQVQGLKKNQTVYFYVTALWNGIESLGSPAVRVQT